MAVERAAREPEVGPPRRAPEFQPYHHCAAVRPTGHGISAADRVRSPLLIVRPESTSVVRSCG